MNNVIMYHNINHAGNQIVPASYRTVPFRPCCTRPQARTCPRPPIFGPLLLNKRHIDRSAFSKAAIRTDPTTGLEGTKPAIGKFESGMVRMQTVQDLPRTLFK